MLLIAAALPMGWYGVSLLWSMPTADKTSIAVWLIAGLLAHDAVFAPLCLAAGHSARRVLPRRWWAPILAAASATLLIVLLALPVVYPRSESTRAPGNAQNGTLLDRPYGWGLTIALLVVWALAIVLIARRHRATDDDGHDGTDPDPA
ncbi:hypothetical protein GCM10009773_38560 [Williamsia serinedens]